MEYTHLGRTGLLVSRLCLGTMAFGNSTDEKESFRIMDEALDLGIKLTFSTRPTTTAKPPITRE